MASTGAEPIGSMGTDTPVAVLAERPRLLLAQRRQRHIDVAAGQVDPRQPLLIGEVAGDVAGAFAVADDPQPFGPSGGHGALLACLGKPMPQRVRRFQRKLCGSMSTASRRLDGAFGAAASHPAMAAWIGACRGARISIRTR